MSEVVEVLRPLMNLKDMASSSFHYQALQAERASRQQQLANGNGQLNNVAYLNGQLSSKNGCPRVILIFLTPHHIVYHQAAQPADNFFF